MLGSSSRRLISRRRHRVVRRWLLLRSDQSLLRSQFYEGWSLTVVIARWDAGSCNVWPSLLRSEGSYEVSKAGCWGGRPSPAGQAPCATPNGATVHPTDPPCTLQTAWVVIFYSFCMKIDKPMARATHSPILLSLTNLWHGRHIALFYYLWQTNGTGDS